MAKTKKPSARGKKPTKKAPARVRRKPARSPKEAPAPAPPDEVEGEDADQEDEETGPAIRHGSGEATRDSFGRFLPGVSGNPEGRPSAQWIRDFLAERNEATTEERRRTIIEALYATAVTRTHKDHVRAGELFLAYSAGKPVQGVEVSGGGGAPVELDVSGMTSEQQNAAWQELLAKATGAAVITEADAAPEDGEDPEAG